MPIEVELKFRVSDHQTINHSLQRFQARSLEMEFHRDTYFRHPCRDFVQTKEALRIRHIEIASSDSGDRKIESRITYKGPKFPGLIKARQELEWDVQSSDPQAFNFAELLKNLGFEAVLTVEKQRRPFVVNFGGHELTIALDTVMGLGTFAEIEVIAADASQIEPARAVVQAFADQLELHDAEPRSYLTMCLQG